MEEKFDIIIELLKKSYYGEISSEERAQLNDLLEKYSMNELYRQLMDEDLLRQSLVEDKFPHLQAYKNFLHAAKHKKSSAVLGDGSLNYISNQPQQNLSTGELNYEIINRKIILSK